MGRTLGITVSTSANLSSSFSNLSPQVTKWSIRKGFRVSVNCAVKDSGDSSSSASAHVERAWEHWNKLGAPKLIVAPMMDQSELPFRMLCRRYGAAAAYTQMFHSRPFALQPGYRRVEFSTCPEDRPLFVQFGANDPEMLLKAAVIVQEHCGYVDINLGMKAVEEVAGSLEELSREGALNEAALALEYLHLCEQYPVTKKMIRARVCKLIVGWFKRSPELRDEMNGEQGARIDWSKGLVYRLLERHVASMAGDSPRESANAEISGLAQQH